MRRSLVALGALVVSVTVTLAVVAPASTSPRTLSFSGYTWEVKSSSGKVGPGPNYFSAATDNVWVDAGGRLHLRMTRKNGHWQCAEVATVQSLGYGTFTLDSRVDALDKNVVLGLFTWSDDPAYANRELDIEFARWGNAGDPTNAGWTVQPYDQPGHGQRFTESSAQTSSQAFTWTPSSVAFTSSSASPGSWTYSAAGVPQAGGEHARMNLWLFQGRAPSGHSSVEVVVKSFRFTP